RREPRADDRQRHRRRRRTGSDPVTSNAESAETAEKNKYPDLSAGSASSAFNRREVRRLSNAESAETAEKNKYQDLSACSASSAFNRREVRRLSNAESA